jgi:membrane protease subunit (stomatin/prohibitin family)
VARWPANGTSDIRLGSQLIVEESQQAVFFRDGKALDTFGPGRHTLATQNIPLLASLFGIPFGGKSPFQAAVVFVSTKTFLDLKWGTKEPVPFRDQELAMVRLRAFGNRLTDVLGENLTSVFDLPRLYDELAMGLKARVADDFTKYGIELVDLYMGAVTPPEEVQKLIDERSGMAALGDMNTYLKFKTARAIGDAAQQEGGGGGNVAAGMGMGVGAGLGMMLPGMMRDAMQGGGQQAPAAPAAGGAAPAAGAAAAGAAAFCHNCGQKLAPGSKFCPGCGTKIG